MNTKIIMSLCAIYLAIMGISFSFLPEEILLHFNLIDTDEYQFFIQLMGAMFFAFAMLNWTAKGSLIGGIYNRPIAVANFTHFMIGGITLIKGILGNTQLPVLFWILTILYIVFAILFGIILFRSPVKEK